MEKQTFKNTQNKEERKQTTKRKLKESKNVCRQDYAPTCTHTYTHTPKNYKIKFHDEVAKEKQTLQIVYRQNRKLKKECTKKPRN